MLPQDILDIGARTRTNPLAWRGQFSPQFVQSILGHYSRVGDLVLDPFAGSGTVIAEALRYGNSALGYEVNPAAMILAKVYCLSILKTDERKCVLTEVESILELSCALGMPLFETAQPDVETSISSLVAGAASCKTSEDTRALIQALVVLLDVDSDQVERKKVWRKWQQLKQIVLELPEATSDVLVQLGDARYLPLEDQCIDFVVTSPPYINVFNYHHNYRKSVELLGWDVLHSAKSEIGANRKFRQNRILTVIQYCIDMSLALADLCRVARNDARIVYVVGKESNVHKTAFYNGAILSTLAQDVLNMNLVTSQERKFTNKYGQLIREDILHLEPMVHAFDLADIERLARELARNVLLEAKERAPIDRLLYFHDAIEKIEEVHASPQFLPIED